MKVIDQINESGFFAQSAYSADTATNDSLGRNISETYQTTAGMTAYQPSGDYLSSKGFTQRITNPSNNKFISFWNEAGGSTATAQPAIYLSGQFGSAYYKDNELKIGRNNHTIAFNIGGSGPKISAAATGTVESFMYVYNAGNSATISESGFNLKNSTANENVNIASIQSWNAKGDMHASSFSYDGNNKISAYNGSAFSVAQVVTSTGGNANYVNQLNNKGISATVAYKARLDEGNHSISALYDTVSTNSASWQTPADVMMETGLEYNAVNEISAYNGSAIAQYGANKQWLQHDDTLLHVANSAQYALGVNVSAVAQLMCVDETVLFSGSSANPTLSESIDNFEHIKVTYTYWPDNYATKLIYGWSSKPTFTDGWFNANGGVGGIFITRLTANDSHTVIGSDANKYWNPPTGTALNDALSNFKILNVIGIGRKGV